MHIKQTGCVLLVYLTEEEISAEKAKVIGRLKVQGYAQQIHNNTI